jgi:sterol desaturase/sphingolipid hydroxylase (fatty acid hydroxylase superfamily)
MFIRWLILRIFLNQIFRIEKLNGMKKFKIVIIRNDLFKVVSSAIISTLLLDICFWLNASMHHKPLDRSAWLKLYKDLLDYTYCETGNDYIIQTIFLACVIALHVLLFFLTLIVVKKFANKYCAQ